MNRIENKNNLSMQKEPVLLSVVISCKACKEILEKNLKALKLQSLDPKLYQLIFVFKEKQQYSDCILLIKNYFPVHKVLFLSKGQAIFEMRNLVLDDCHSSYIYFIDEDVILDDPEHLARLLELHNKFPDFTVIGGGYEDHLDNNFLGRSYNWTVRLWMKKHKGFVPAGNLSIKTNKTFKARFYSPNPFGFGGEEVYFLQALQKEGHQLFSDETLAVKHLVHRNLKDFIKRAWFHGASLTFQQKTKNSSFFLFLKEPGAILIKISALFYLLLVRLSFLFYKITGI